MVSSSSHTRGKSPLAHKSPLAQWFQESIAPDGTRVQFRLRGNNLHILCEADPVPEQTLLLGRLLPALQTVNLNTLVPANQPDIYQVFLYGKGVGRNRADWTTPIDLSQLDHHLAQFQQMQLEALGFLEPETAEESLDARLETLLAVSPALNLVEQATDLGHQEHEPTRAAQGSDTAFSLKPESAPNPSPDQAAFDLQQIEPDATVFSLSPEPAQGVAAPAQPLPTQLLELLDETSDAVSDAAFSLQQSEAKPFSLSPEPQPKHPEATFSLAPEPDLAADSEVPQSGIVAFGLQNKSLQSNDLQSKSEPVELAPEPDLAAELEGDGLALRVVESSAEPLVLSFENNETEAKTFSEVAFALSSDPDQGADLAAAEHTLELASAETEAFSLTAEAESGTMQPVLISESDLSRESSLLLEVASLELPSGSVDAGLGADPSVVEAEIAGSGRSPFQLAQTGEPGAIARFLAERLSQQNIAVQVQARTMPYPGTSGIDAIARTVRSPQSPQRLWILCEATYSPAPAALAEPIATQLRSLNLQGFRDAIVVVQVQGEATPDWMLRVDLTPSQAMLQEWAQWGDVQTLTRLLNQALLPEACGIVSASLQESTLHLVCSLLPSAPLAGEDGSAALAAPDQSTVQATAERLLQTLAPQGIQAAALYGQVPEADAPAWVAWLTLPAASHAQRAASALDRARQQDWGAIAFLLNRLLNPNLDQQLATGGIRLQLRPKPDRTQQIILHIMADAPLCPEQDAVGVPIERFLRELQLPQLAGVRVYGRQAGQKRPLWCHSVDLLERIRLVPEAVPEFAASDAYVGELISPAGLLALRSELSAEDIQSAWNRMRDRLSNGVRQVLLKTHLLTTDAEAPARAAQTSWGVAMIWGVAGLLLAVQMDWGLARGLQPQANAQARQEDLPQSSPSVQSVRSADVPTDASADPESETDPASESSTFRDDGFTQTEESVASGAEVPDLQFTPSTVQSQLQTAQVLAQDSPYPTFNSPQLDEKILLYYERMKEQAAPSDVLIVGSSRALRGIDPVALQRELATLGYDDVTVFNFGINGATAQVADLVLRQVLEAPQLPKLIVWADGARAFNSNAVDVTYNGMAVSPAYRDLRLGQLQRPDLTAILGSDEPLNIAPETPSRGIDAPLQASYAAIDQTLSSGLGDVSATFPLRDRLKTRFQEAIARFLPSQFAVPGRAAGLPNSALPESFQSLSDPDREMIDFDGFLPLSLRFNPATYFQSYARVPGRYDGDYLDFRLPGAQTEAMNALLKEMGDRQIPVVFINLPLTDEYLDGDRQAHEQTFRQFMVETDLRSPTLVFRDLSELWLEDYDYFSDPSHLNRYGAYEVSRRLAQDPLIPWSVLHEEGESTTTAQQSAQ